MAGTKRNLDKQRFAWRREPGKLTPYDKAFITEFMKDWHGVSAARRLGYAGTAMGARKHACMVLGVPEVRAEINRRLEARKQRLEINEDAVLHEYARVAFANIGDALVYDDEGCARIELGKLTQDQLAAISAVEIDKKGGIRVRMHDKLDALEKLGKRLRLFGREDAPPVATVQFIIEDSPRPRRIAAQVTLGNQAKDTMRVIEHETESVEARNAPPG
jgi:phage terminase small subunit